MSWLYIALLAPALSALGNYADKYLLVSREKSGGVAGIILFSCFFGLVVMPISLFFDPGALATPLLEASVLMVNGGLSILALVAYLYAIRDSDVVSVVPALQTIPVFGFVLGYAVLGETLNALQLIGSLIIIAGAFILSLEINEEGGFRVRKKSLSLALVSSFVFALSGVIFKLVAVEQGYWASQFWEYLGMAVLGVALLIVLRSYRDTISDLITARRHKYLTLNLTGESIMVASDLSLNYATLLAPIALVYTVNAFQPAFLFGYGALGIILLPRMMERLSYSGNRPLIKALTIGIMIAGAVMLHL